MAHFDGMSKPTDSDASQESRAQGHHFELLAPSSYLCMERIDAATKFKFCAKMHNGRVLPADQKLCRNVPVKIPLAYTMRYKMQDKIMT